MKSRPLLQALLSLSLLCAAPAFAGDAPAKSKRPEGGDMAPDGLGRVLSGDAVRVSDFKGKVVVVSFWATWCPYCLKELPILANIQRVAGSEKLAVVAVNTEDRQVFRNVVRALEKEPGLGLRLTYDPDKASQKAYGVSGLPHMLIIDREGRIVRLYVGYGESQLDSIAADLNKALAEPAAGG